MMEVLIIDVHIFAFKRNEFVADGYIVDMEFIELQALKQVNEY